ncbi:hypothetical protein G7Z17_g5612 [Cylindrodendrum hubeiense]|uniref:Carboxylic ester hydrolase n=1 Tax=Cylindrodendrum hubeiense TaxID=595255 RepID=A0A9P5LBK8_9HYPO|nr:hypothetical protein G7Z17_g5612 [Cylindrodendrum hubeiense]
MASSLSPSTITAAASQKTNRSDPTRRLLASSNPNSSYNSDANSITSSNSDSENIQATAKPNPRRRRNLLIGLVAVISLVLLALGLGLYYGLRNRDNGSDNGSGDGLGDGPAVDLGYSKYKGNSLDNGVNEFLGMRFAKPPTGDLRWRAPVDPEHTKPTQSAQRFRAFCPGVGQKLSASRDEDCLFVNVWGPNSAADAKLPVMVFIQGGGYMSNSRPTTNGSLMVETSDKNMVFVSFNYRVGLFGFLAGDDVKSDGDLNAGLLDQRFLLKWVQKHISKFGGDPDHVVIQGMSAGAGSVALHLAAYGGRDDGLFIGAIAESTFFPGQQNVSDLEYQYDRVVADAGCDDADDKMDCLRGKDKEELQEISRPRAFYGRTDSPNFYWTPCTDGDFLRDTPYAMFKEGDFIKVPVLIGSCTNEGSNFVPNASDSDKFVSFMQDNYPGLNTNNTDSMLEQYPIEDTLPTRAPWFPSTSRAYGEATFICPTNNVLNAFRAANSSSANATIFSYRYNLQDKASIASGRGVPHVFEAPAVFGPTMVNSAASYFTYNADIVPIVMNYWISFVRALDPNPYRYDDAPRWLPWGDTQRRLVLQLQNSTMETVPKNETERCSFWHNLNETMAQ